MTYKKINGSMVFVVILLITICVGRNLIIAEEENPKNIFYLNNDREINEPLFKQDRKIIPGDVLAKEFYILNNNDFKCSLKRLFLEGKLYDKSGQLINEDNALYKNYMKNSLIRIFCEDEEVFNGNLEKLVSVDFTDDKLIYLEKNDKKKFKIEYTLNKIADNSIMGLQYKFNINANFSSIDSAVVSPIEKDVSGTSIVQTGSFLDMKVLVIFGASIFSLGIVLVIRKNNKGPISK